MICCYPSANLTECAMNLNMGLGVLIRGGELPGQVRVRLIGRGCCGAFVALDLAPR